MTVTYRAGVDIGGTFTDIVLLGSDGTVHTKKISSSVGNYAQAIVDGLSEVFGETGLSGAAIDEIRRGTTVASNAILEHKGAVADFVDCRAGKAGLAKNFAQPVDDRLGVVADTGRDLLGVDGAVGAQQHDIREGAADVDTGAIGDSHRTIPRRVAAVRARATAPWASPSSRAPGGFPLDGAPSPRRRRSRRWYRPPRHSRRVPSAATKARSSRRAVPPRDRAPAGRPSRRHRLAHAGTP